MAVIVFLGIAATGGLSELRGGVPSIETFTPKSGSVGTSVTITGTGFSSVPAENIVHFGTGRASVASASPTSLIVSAPASATFSSLTVTVNGLTAWSASPFMLTFPNSSISDSAAVPAIRIAQSESTELPPGYAPHYGRKSVAVAIGDLDDDGKPDIAVSNFGSNTVTLFHNEVNGGNLTADSFRRIDVPTGTETVSVAVIDVDGDGKLDVINGNVVLRNVGPTGSLSTNSFARSYLPINWGYLPPSNPDLDGDGRPDLAITYNAGPGSIRLLRNVGAGEFAASGVLLDNFQTFHPVAIGDLSGDGKADIAAVSSPAVWVYVNKGNSVALSTNTFGRSVGFSADTQPDSVAVGDLDGDGKNDLAVASAYDRHISIYRTLAGVGDPVTFGTRVILQTGIAPVELVVGDFNGDGKPELIVVSSDAVSVFRNTSTIGAIDTNSFAPGIKFLGGAFNSAALGDLDGDSKPELVIAANWGRDVLIYRNLPTARPAILQHPQELRAVAGTNITLRVTAISTSPLSFQWLFNDASISGATSSNLFLSAVSSAHAGNYRVVVSNAFGVEVSSNAVLIVSSNVVPPRIVVHPRSQSVQPGATVIFTVQVTGTGPFNYQWRFSAAPIFATGGSLSLENVQSAEAGTYWVEVSNSAGSVTSTGAVLSVNVPPNTSPKAVSTCDQLSLRSALEGGGHVRFECDGTIRLNRSIVISNDTVLDANGHDVGVSGNDRVRVFKVESGVSFRAIGLTLAHGRSSGQIGFPPATNAIPGIGAGIHNDGGTVDLVSCQLISNVVSGIALGPAGGSQYAHAFGGAIYSSGNLSVRDCFFSHNRAIGGGGGGYFYGQGSDGLGGALYTTNGTISVVDTRFHSNAAAGGGASFGDIQGSGLTGNGLGGAVFTASTEALFSNVTFRANQAAAGHGGERIAFGNGQGGALYVGGTARVVNSTFFDNTVPNGSFCQGGAILSKGSLTINNSWLADNVVKGPNGSYNFHYSQAWGHGLGGGLYNEGSLMMTNCAISGNVAEGGGLQAFLYGGAKAGEGRGGGLVNASNAVIVNTTIALNRALGGQASGSADPSDALGGGVHHWGSSLEMVNVTIASNSVSGGTHPNPSRKGISAGSAVYIRTNSAVMKNSIVASGPGQTNCFGILADGGHNISSDSSCMFTAAGSMNNTDPMLNRLSIADGATPTMALLPGSSAIDRADASTCPPTDQRGVVRPQLAGCDIGAYELKSDFLQITSLVSSGDGKLEIGGLGIRGTSFKVLASSDLTTWHEVANGSVNDSSRFEVIIPATSSSGFYRLAKP